VDRSEHELVNELLKLDNLIDVVIPRGGEALIQAVVENSRIPVIKHYKGLCHVYVDAGADLEMAHKITRNAKVQRPGVCNAAETLLVHADIAEEFLPSVCDELAGAGVELRGCDHSRELCRVINAASEEDWSSEYLTLILSVKIVSSLDEAIEHINRYGSGHTDGIVTNSIGAVEEFVAKVDSASVMVNASTRLSDGGVYGLGAEVGISTDKLHARGPMGAADLTTYKYVVYGQGHLRA
jgi:glutamate-5-semialdehyde dehydrogenase